MTRVAIIGGGIGGLTAANALSRAGIEVAVYEAAAELREIGAGVALHPNAMKVLRAIGVEDGVRAVAYVQGGKLALRSRKAVDLTDRYPELGPLPDVLAAHDVVVDGQIVVREPTRHIDGAHLVARVLIASDPDAHDRE